METFKTLDEVTIPDPRMDFFHIYDEALGDFRKKELSDLHRSLSQINLSESVPESIRTHFTTSKHLVLYSWFVYRFIPVAEMHAITSLEYALKIKTGKERWGLKKLLTYAVKNGWVKDTDFEIHRQSEERNERSTQIRAQLLGTKPNTDHEKIEGQYTLALVESLPFLRNIYAHGSSTIAPQGYLTLKICSEFINKVFENE